MKRPARAPRRRSAPTTAARLLRGLGPEGLPFEAAVEALLDAAADGLPDATLDHDRARRCGAPEVVFGQGKTPAQGVAIARRLLARHGRVFVTRAAPELQQALGAAFAPAGAKALAPVVVNERARTVRIGAPPRATGRVAVVAAGTADLPVADEAAETLIALGSRVERVGDVGVAGIHRLVPRLPLLRRARVVIVVAGMEGALPSVVQGLLDRPVVAVPTSVGYGAHFRGLTSLLAMLNACAAGITVVNIDNGFGAGYAAHLINRTGVK